MTALFIESLIRRTANRFGIDIKRHRPGAVEFGRLPAMLTSHGINFVFDVGANTGQFARSLRAAGYEGQIVSFEPLLTAHEVLIQSSQGDPRWQIAPRGAIGRHEGEVEIHIAGNSVSSSALEMLDSHANAAPGSVYVSKEVVRLATLDTMARDYLTRESVPFIKIDTQGYEDRVLDGATTLLSKTQGLQLELSLVPLYEGQHLFDALSARLQELGFSVWAIWPGFSDPRTGRMLQVDATFFRE